MSNSHLGSRHGSDTDSTLCWDDQTENWVRWAREDGGDHFFYEYNWPAFTQLLPAELGRTLDIGCGEGRSTRKLAELTDDVTGLEPSRILSDSARNNGSFVVTAPAEDQPFTDGLFDTVVAFMVLHDVDDLDATVREVRRVTRDGGHFCFSIIHPFASAGSWHGDNFMMSDSYWHERRYVDRDENNGNRMEFHSVHRPIQDYVDALVGNGFTITGLSEARPADGYLARHESAGFLRDVPLYLHVSAVAV